MIDVEDVELKPVSDEVELVELARLEPVLDTVELDAVELVEVLVAFEPPLASSA